MMENIQALLTTIDEFDKSGFHDDKLMDKALSQYEQLLPIEKKQVLNDMYTVFRGKFDSYGNANQYIDACLWIDKVYNNASFKNDSKDNQMHFMIDSSKVLLMNYLELKHDEYLIRAKSFIENINHIPNQMFDRFTEVQEMLNAINLKKLTTITTFNVPITMKECDDEQLSITLPNYTVNIIYKSVRKDENNGSVQGYVQRLADKDSLLLETRWTVEIDEYLSFSQNSKIAENTSELNEVVCQAINKVIEAYQIRTGEYWIRNIYPNMIAQQSIKYFAGKNVFYNIPLYDGSTYEMSFKPMKIHFGDIFKKPIPLYKKLLMDANNHLFSEELREAVLFLNASFENYTYSTVCPLIVELSNGQFEDKFYYKTMPYNQFYLKAYISETDYKNAIENKDIKPTGLSMYRIYKIFRDISPNFHNQISATKLNRLISKIRKYRNDYSHGSDGGTIVTRNQVKTQIDALENLMQMIDTVKDN